MTDGSRRSRDAILAARAYPDGPSGFCSRIHPDELSQAECPTCYPDLWALIAEHNRLKQAAWTRLRELGEAIPHA